MKNKHLFYIAVFLAFLGTMSCNNHDYTPRPRGYFRIDLPEKEWKLYDSLSTYSFEYPVYADVIRDPHSVEEDEWLNINFEDFKASIHLSYKEVTNNFNELTEDARSMVMQHLVKASIIQDSLFTIPERNLHGMVYQIKGKGVASPIQFYISDSSNHFIRAALYFNFRPNNDSVEPIISFVKRDILHFIETVNWKK